MAITIVSRWDKTKVLYAAENAVDVREALQEAARAGADLSGADLRSAYLSSADLGGADLSSADLRSADLSSAYLRSADLSSAYLRSAYLGGADLSSAYLSSADLRSADLSSAYLSSAYEVAGGGRNGCVAMSTITMVAPDRSVEQRLAALCKANEIRVARSKLKRDIKHGHIALADILTMPPAYTSTMKVQDLLLAAPKIGRVKASKLMRRAGVSPSKSLVEISPQRRAELALLGGSR